MRRSRHASVAASQRDELLAVRRPAGWFASGAQIARLRELADVARSLGDQLAALLATSPPRRQAIDVPRGRQGPTADR